MKYLVGAGHDGESGWFGQAAGKSGGHAASLDIHAVGDRAELADGSIHPGDGILLAAVWMRVGDDDHVPGSFQHVVANDDTVNGVFGNYGGGHVDPRFSSVEIC